MLLAELVGVGLISMTRIVPLPVFELEGTVKNDTAILSLLAKSLRNGATWSVVTTISSVTFMRIFWLEPLLGVFVGEVTPVPMLEVVVVPLP